MEEKNDATEITAEEIKANDIEIREIEADNTKPAEKEPKVELTEEEAKIAAENVGQILDVLKQYKTPQEKRKEKFERMKKEQEELPEGHYKKKQLAYKMLELSKKISPKIFWNSNEKGTYRKKGE